MGLIARSIATSAAAPDYVAMEAPKNQNARGGFRVYLGTIPDYAQGDIKGVKLSGVSPVGPAAKAGVKSGDIIVKLGRQGRAQHLRLHLLDGGIEGRQRDEHRGSA